MAQDAWREIGEAAFDDRRYREAVQAFENSLKTDRKREAAARVLHRMAWSHYRLKQYDRAVATLKESVTVANLHGESLLSVREEALRDMAIFMTEAGRVEEAIQYFQTVAGDKSFYPATLEKLGKQYERNVEVAKAIQVYESLLKTNPEDEATLRVRAKLVELDLKNGKIASAAARVRQAKMDSSVLKHKGNSETQTALQNLRAQIRRTATESHERYRKKGNSQDLTIAELFYETYLNPLLAAWDPRKEIPEIQMYLAEVKRDLGKAKEASELYRTVVDSEDPRYAKEAGALWTASLADSIKKESRVASHVGKETRLEPSVTEREFVAAADAMQDSLGKTQEGREAALKAAQVLGGYAGTKKEAKKRAERLVEEHPEAPQAQTAARLWIQLVSDELPSDIKQVEISKAASELRDVIEELKKNQPLMREDQSKGGGKLAQLFMQWENRLKAGVIAEQEKNRDFDDAARSYEEFAKTAPDAETSEKAWASAFDSWIKAKQMPEAERVLQSWAKAHPKSVKPLEAARFIATQSLIEGRYQAAADGFERLGLLDPKSAPDSWSTAARMAETIGDQARAVTLFERAIQSAQASVDLKASLALTLGAIYIKEAKSTDAARVYRLGMGEGTVTLPDALQCRFELAKLYLKARDIVKAKAVLASLAEVKGAGPYRAEALGMMAQIEVEDLGPPAPFILPEEALKKSVQSRFAYLEKLGKIWAPVIQAGGSAGLNALNRLSLAAWQTASDLEALVLPVDWPEERKKALRSGFPAVVNPLKNQAVAQWKTAWDRAQKDGIFSSATPEINDRLVLAQVAGIERAQGLRARWRLAGISPDGGEAGNTQALAQVRQKLSNSPKNAGLWVDYGNLLWGEGRLSLARLAYDRALALNSNSASALSNRAVFELQITPQSTDDPIVALKAIEYLKRAISVEDFHLPSRMNLALLYNYYRLFGLAKPFWDQVSVKATSADAWDGLAIALQGLGKRSEAEAAFTQADKAGGVAGRFARRYHQTIARATCAERKSDIEFLQSTQAQGFEKQAIERIAQECL